MFDSLGFSETTLLVYRAVLQQPLLARRSDMPDLCLQLGLSEETIQAEMDRMRELGLIVPRWTAVDEDYPLHPAIGFERLAAKRQEQIDEMAGALRSDQQAAGRFIADYSEFLQQTSSHEVEVYRGRDRAHQRMQHFQPTKSVWGLLTDPEPSDREPSDSPDIPLLERGVEIRTIYPESALKHASIRKYARYVIDRGVKIRVTPSLPMKILIFDGESAVMGIDPDDTAVGAVVHHSRAVVRVAEELFLSYWHKAVDPFELPYTKADREITAQESEFLRLLVQGGTDEQVARKLGVSLRTVRRIAAKLSEQVGASGRFELGVRAAQRGWVD
ncbi:LuxR C-terminal-related transcriptional regulator [Kribbella sp. NPDC050459]|uniref:helix-turn-helix transcriptional regulator n=1 Tax=Kribbella sp. NPDC050459 TaxID=3155785 RepID=UPI0033D4310A